MKRKYVPAFCLLLTSLVSGVSFASDPTAGWSPYARYGDFLSSQMKSLRKFGYGMYVAKMQAADGPVCSTFWLYADCPAPGCMPEINQLWRWNEFDVEFVPYTLACQNSYITLDGTFPHPSLAYYGSTMDWTNMTSGQITSTSVLWVAGRIMNDNTVFFDMQKFYNEWMVDRNNPLKLISSNDFNYLGALRTTGPGFMNGGDTNNPAARPGWRYASQWKYPLTAVKPPPTNLSMRRMATLNWWRMPAGNQRMTVTMPGFSNQVYDFVVKEDGIKDSTATQSFTRAAMNNETYVLPHNSSYNPCTNLNVYTIVWSKTRVAFYINAGSDGTNIAGATPIEVFALSNYPSMSHAGTQAPQGRLPWVDTSLSDKLGEVSINLANYVAFRAAIATNNAGIGPSNQAGAGWSGLPPGTNWFGVTSYVRSVKFFPLASEQVDGSQPSHFDFRSTNVWSFDLADGSWNETNFQRKMSSYFGILHAQDFTKYGIGVTNLRDAKSPMAVRFVPNRDGSTAPDKLPVMALVCRPSEASPKRNFYRLATAMDTKPPISAGNPFMYATIAVEGREVGVSGASTPLCIYAPPPGSNLLATIKLYMTTLYHGAFPPNAVPKAPNATATLLLQQDAHSNISWQVVHDTNGIVETYQSENPYMITVKRGSNYRPSLAESPYQHDFYLKDTNHLWWHPGEDLDVGGGIAGYQVQIAADESFGQPIVDVTNHIPATSNLFVDGGPWTLGGMVDELLSDSNLQAQAHYFWRVRAQDTSGEWSDWILEEFDYGMTPPLVRNFEMRGTNQWRFEWTGEGTNYAMQYSTQIVDAAWQTVTTPAPTNEHSLEPDAAPVGFYRVFAQ